MVVNNAASAARSDLTTARFTRTGSTMETLWKPQPPLNDPQTAHIAHGRQRYPHTIRSCRHPRAHGKEGSSVRVRHWTWSNFLHRRSLADLLCRRELEVASHGSDLPPTSVTGHRARCLPFGPCCGPRASPCPDLVQRAFSADRPESLWVADLSYLRCWEGLLFFAFVIDVFPRASWAGSWQPTCAPVSSPTLCGWRCIDEPRAPTSRSCTTPTPAANTPRSTSPRRSPTTEGSSRSGGSATPTTTR